MCLTYNGAMAIYVYIYRYINSRFVASAMLYIIIIIISMRWI